MSIIRLSVLKDVVYAPDADGDIKLLEYDEDRRVGDEDTRIPDGVPKHWWNFGD